MTFEDAEGALELATTAAQAAEFAAMLKQAERDRALRVPGADPHSPPCSTLIEDAYWSWLRWTDLEYARVAAYKVAASLAPP